MSLLNAVGDYIREHKSEIAFGAGVLLTGATTVLAVKQTPQAMESINEESRRKGRDLSFWEKVKVSWKYYIFPTATEVLGLTCLFYGKSIDMKAPGAALAFADASQKLLKTYTEKVVEEIGEEKEEHIRRAVVAEKAKEDHAVITGSEDCCLMDGDAWYYDPLFGKKFISSDLKIKSAINVVNHQLLTNDYATYNDFYDEIRTLTPVSVNNDLVCDFGDAFGFKIGNGLVDVEYEPLDLGIRVNGVKTPAFSIRFINKESGSTRFPELVV